MDPEVLDPGAQFKALRVQGARVEGDTAVAVYCVVPNIVREDNSAILGWVNICKGHTRYDHLIRKSRVESVELSTRPSSDVENAPSEANFRAAQGGDARRASRAT